MWMLFLSHTWHICLFLLCVFFALRVAFLNSTCTTSNWLLCQKMHVSFATFEMWKNFFARLDFSISFGIRHILKSYRFRDILQGSASFQLWIHNLPLDGWIFFFFAFLGNKVPVNLEYYWSKRKQLFSIALAKTGKSLKVWAMDWRQNKTSCCYWVFSFWKMNANMALHNPFFSHDTRRTSREKNLDEMSLDAQHQHTYLNMMIGIFNMQRDVALWFFSSITFHYPVFSLALFLSFCVGFRFSRHKSIFQQISWISYFSRHLFSAFANGYMFHGCGEITCTRFNRYAKPISSINFSYFTHFPSEFSYTYRCFCSQNSHLSAWSVWELTCTVYPPPSAFYTYDLIRSRSLSCFTFRNILIDEKSNILSIFRHSTKSSFFIKMHKNKYSACESSFFSSVEYGEAKKMAE